MSVFAQPNRFRTQDDQCGNGVTTPLIARSDDSRVLQAAPIAGLKRIFRPHLNYNKAALMLQGSSALANYQTTRFDDASCRENAAHLMDTLPLLNERLGRDSLPV